MISSVPIPPVAAALRALRTGPLLSVEWSWRAGAAARNFAKARGLVRIRRDRRGCYWISITKRGRQYLMEKEAEARRA